MRTTQSDLDRVQRITDERGTRSRSEGSLTSLQGGPNVGSPWLLEKDTGRSPLSEYMSLIHLSHTTETSTLSRIKYERYIFIKKYVRSFIEVRKLCLIIFPLIFVLWLYNTCPIAFYWSVNDDRAFIHSDRRGEAKIPSIIFDWIMRFRITDWVRGAKHSWSCIDHLSLSFWIWFWRGIK